MCNHFRKGQKILEWSQVRIPGLMPSLPFDDAVLAEHTYPKFLAPVVVQQAGERTMVAKAWGIPMTIKGATKPLTKHVTNARNDKLLGYPWRFAARERRCLIPGTGYFEPGSGPVGAKGEILFTVKAQPCFFFAGLWDGEAFTMVTTEPNDHVRPYHDRMPVVLHDEDALEWLGNEPLPDDALRRLCRGLRSEALQHEALPAKLAVVRPAKPAEPSNQPELF